MSKRVALVLGSGGARGYAHIGVIEELEARGYDVVAIAGCSMGAVIGGVYAAGELQGYRDWVTQLDYFDVLRLVDVTWNPMGAMRASKVMMRISKLVGDTRIEDLPIPLTTVATDIGRQREVWFQSGPLLQAIRASIAVPGIITPVHIGDQVLVDGGLLNPLPIIPTVSAQADLILAVNATAQTHKPVTLEELLPPAETGRSCATKTRPSSAKPSAMLEGRASRSGSTVCAAAPSACSSTTTSRPARTPVKTKAAPAPPSVPGASSTSC